MPPQSVLFVVRADIESAPTMYNQCIRWDGESVPLVGMTRPLDYVVIPSVAEGSHYFNRPKNREIPPRAALGRDDIYNV